MSKSSSSDTPMGRVIAGGNGHRTPGPSPTSNYVDIDHIQSAEGLVAIISLRRSTGVITFAIMREYEQDGAMTKTSFCPENYGPAYLEMVKIVIERIAKFRREGLPPAALAPVAQNHR